MIMLDNLPTPEARAAYIADQARNLVALAEEIGVSLRIERVAVLPPRTGHMAHVVDAWPARHGGNTPG